MVPGNTRRCPTPYGLGLQVGGLIGSRWPAHPLGAELEYFGDRRRRTATLRSPLQSQQHLFLTRSKCVEGAMGITGI